MMGEERWVGDSDDDSRGVEISIAGGGGEMVCGLSLGPFFFFFSFFSSFFFLIMGYLFLGTKSLMQR